MSRHTHALVASAWFTNKRIRQKAEAMKARVVVSDKHENAPSGWHVVRKDEGAMMHYKFMVLGNGKEWKEAIFGSYNFTENANRNDEYIKVSTDKGDIEHLVESFEALFPTRSVLAVKDLWPEFGERPGPVTILPNNVWSHGGERSSCISQIRQNMGNCTRCGLCDSRTNIVFGEGNPKARLMFVGEAPGQNEDLQCRPFVGKARDLLDKMILEIGLDREDVYISHIIKCRTPDNRKPTFGEVKKCAPFITQQIDTICPDVIVTFGKLAANTILKRDGSITQICGKWQSIRCGTDLQHLAVVMPLQEMIDGTWSAISLGISQRLYL
jgi:DNA polymerase